MPRPTTLSTIALEAKVSPGTVSRILNDRTDMSISDATRCRVREIALQLGYQPNTAAQALVKGKTNLMALWIGDVHRPIFSRVIQQNLLRAEASGYQILIEQVYNSAGKHLPMNASLFKPRVDAMIVHNDGGFIDELLDSAIRLPPLVGLDHSSSRCDFVAIDHYNGSLEALRHLVRLGCRRIAFLSLAGSHRDTAEKPRAYLKVMEECGMTPEVILCPSAESEGALQTMSEYLVRSKAPDGLFCFNDEMAIGANRAARLAGVRIPEQMAIIGADGIPDMVFQNPTLSTTVLPLEEMCMTAWQFLLRRLKDPTLPLQQITLPTKLIARESTQR